MRYGGVKIADARDKVSSAIEASRDELLDLGLRNPLLNYRPSKARGVEVVDELPTEIFRILVDERKAMTFKAGPEDLGSETEQYDLLAQPEEVTDDGGAGRPTRRPSAADERPLCQATIAPAQD